MENPAGRDVIALQASIAAPWLLSVVGATVICDPTEPVVSSEAVKLKTGTPGLTVSVTVAVPVPELLVALIV
jgi:hypothetical protein